MSFGWFSGKSQDFSNFPAPQKTAHSPSKLNNEQPHPFKKTEKHEQIKFRTRIFIFLKGNNVENSSLESQRSGFLKQVWYFAGIFLFWPNGHFYVMKRKNFSFLFVHFGWHTSILIWMPQKRGRHISILYFIFHYLWLGNLFLSGV